MSLLVWGCGDPKETSNCVDSVPSAACTPLYEPTFTNVYEQTIKPHCAANGSGCHELSASRGALGFGDQSATYETLMSRGTLGPMVTPGDPQCSLLVVSLETTDLGALMPPGSRLSAEERCAVTQWVRMGAHP